MKTNNDPVEFRKIRDFNQSINDCFTFIKQQIKPMFKPLVYICGFFILASMVTQVMQQLKVAKVMGLAKPGGMWWGNAEDVERYSFGTSYFLLILFAMLSVSMVYLVTFCYIKLYKEQQNTAPDLEQVWTLFKQHFFLFFIGAVVMGIVLVLGFICCIIPGIYLFPVITLALPIMVMEDKGILEAFSRALDLIKERWWKTFGLFFVVGIITYFSMSILGIPSALMSVGAIFLQSSPKLVFAGTVFGAVLSSLAQLFYVLPAIAGALWYFSLVEEKEGTGLMDRIEEIGQQGKTDPEWPNEDY